MSGLAISRATSPERLFESLSGLYNTLPFALREATKSLRYDALFHYRSRTRARLTFYFDGAPYPYFFAQYNGAWGSERTVEVPLATKVLDKFANQLVLEVGNVLSHYRPIEHEVVDKYEVAPRVINEDVVDIARAQPYDLIISVSTLEHVGWDEYPQDTAKFGRAVEHLRSLLAPGGMLFFTVPLGYNPGVDAALSAQREAWNALFLRRVSQANDWVQASYAAVQGSTYGEPFGCAGALAVCTLSS